LAGFIGKFYLFSSVIQRGGFWYVVLAVIGVLNSAVSLYYYMKVTKAMWLSAPADDKPLGAHPGYVALTTLLAVPTIVLGLYWSPLSGPIKSSIAFFRSPAAAIQASAGPQK